MRDPCHVICVFQPAQISALIEKVARTQIPKTVPGSSTVTLAKNIGRSACLPSFSEQIQWTVICQRELTVVPDHDAMTWHNSFTWLTRHKFVTTPTWSPLQVLTEVRCFTCLNLLNTYSMGQRLSLNRSPKGQGFDFHYTLVGDNFSITVEEI